METFTAYCIRVRAAVDGLIRPRACKEYRANGGQLWKVFKLKRKRQAKGLIQNVQHMLEREERERERTMLDNVKVDRLTHIPLCFVSYLFLSMKD